ncbi:hypothetical protein DAMA08_001500 [Martiniozyma asiatica (nom. inval.)]|nr:hypothetical protein DAMA08_001500 [Martiniozyma asiatica]
MVRSQPGDFRETARFFPAADLFSIEPNLNFEADLAVMAMVMLDFNAILSRSNSSNLSVSVMVLLRKAIFHYIIDFFCFHKFLMQFEVDYILEKLFDLFLYSKVTWMIESGHKKDFQKHAIYLL